MAEKIFDTIQLLRGKLSDYLDINPILDEGELAVVFDSNTNKPIGIKAGNGELSFKDLPFMGAGSIETYTKEEIDSMFEETGKTLDVLKLNYAALLEVISPSASKDNKLVTISEVKEMALVPTEDQLKAINSGITSEILQKLLLDVNNKLDKKTNVTAKDQAYVKSANGTNKMVNITDGTSQLDNGLALKTAGRVKTAKAVNSTDAVNKDDLDAGLKGKLDAQDAPTEDTYAYTTKGLMQVSQEKTANAVVERTSKGTINISDAQENSEAASFGQLSEVSDNLNAHINNENNPHKVTYIQAGAEKAGSVNEHNLSEDAHAELFNKKQEAIKSPANPQSYFMKPPITQGGDPVLGNLSDLASSIALANEIDRAKGVEAQKVDKKEGYSLSQNDFTDVLKEQYDNAVNKLAGVSQGAQANTIEKIILNGSEITPNAVKAVNLTDIARASEVKVVTDALKAEDTALAGKITTAENSIETEKTRALAAEANLKNSIDNIQELIPNAATESNQLADKDFVNSSIASNTGTFRGTYKLSESEFKALPWTSTDSTSEYYVQNNDYAFLVAENEPVGVDVYRRYKCAVTGTSILWSFEYALNNSSFTAEQWAAINSGITNALVGKITTNESNISELDTTVRSLKVGLGSAKSDITLLENDVSALKTTVNETTSKITDIENNKEDTYEVFVNGWFTTYTWAVIDGTNTFIADLEGKLTVGEDGTKTAYGTYIDNLRDLSLFSVGDRLPFDSKNDCYYLGKTDETEYVKIAIPELGKSIIISVDDTGKQIVFTDKFLDQSLDTTDLQNYLDTNNYVKEVTKTYNNDSFMAYNAEGEIFNSGIKKSDLVPVEDSYQPKLYCKPLTEGAFAEIYNSPDSTTNLAKGGWVFPSSADCFLKSGGNSNIVKVGLVEGTIYQNIHFNENLVFLPVCNKAESPEADPHKGIFKDCSFNLLLFKNEGESANTAQITDFTFYNSTIIIDSLPLSFSNSDITIRAYNSTIILNLSEKTLPANIIMEIDNSHIDFTCNEMANHMLSFTKCFNSEIILHDMAKISFTRPGSLAEHEETAYEYFSAIRVTLASDYIPSQSIAVDTSKYGGEFIWKAPYYLVDLRRADVSSAPVAILLGDISSSEATSIKGYLSGVPIIEDTALVEGSETEYLSAYPGFPFGKIIHANWTPHAWTGKPSNVGAYVFFGGGPGGQVGLRVAHRCGYIAPNFYIPKVKTYRFNDEYTNKYFEEVYDSTQIDIKTGKIFIQSDDVTGESPNIKGPVYLVIIS